jgi:hypothetical protein
MIAAMDRHVDLPPWWWGPFGGTRDPRPIARYIADGALDAESAAWLWLAIEAGASTIVCAGPSGAGKTTLLTSLLAFLHPGRAPYVVHGRYERFERIRPDNAAHHALLINEISSHLPGYLWGPALAKAHELARSGAQLLATAHADEVSELVAQLLSMPNDLAMTDLDCWTCVIFLDAWIEQRVVHREVRAVETLLIDEAGRLTAESLSIRAHRRGPPALDRAAWRRLAARLGFLDRLDQELPRRAALLREPALTVPWSD